MEPFESGPQASGVSNSIRADLELLTPDDVCEMLQVKKDWLYNQVEAERMPCVRLGRQLRFRPSQIDAWLRGEWQPEHSRSHPEPSEPPPVSELVRRRVGRPRKN